MRKVVINKSVAWGILCILAVAFWAPASHGSPLKVTIPLADGSELAGYSFTPENPVSNPMPGVVVAANVGGAKLVQYHTYCRNLANRNFSVLLIDATNFPETLTPGPETWRRMPYHIWAWATHLAVVARLTFGNEWYLQTMQAAVDHMSRDSRVDPRKIALSGFSQSANAALPFASRDSRIKGVVWNNGGWPWVMPFDPKKLPPVLIFHGEEDGVYNVKYARNLASKLEQAKCECECYIYPKQRHMFNIYFDLNKEGDCANPVLTSSFEHLVNFLNRVFHREVAR